MRIRYELNQNLSPKLLAFPSRLVLFARNDQYSEGVEEVCRCELAVHLCGGT